MQWLFLRQQPKDSWRSAGAKGAGGYVLKINGLLRSPLITYEKASKYDRSKKYTLEKPGTKAGSGRSTLTYLTGHKILTALNADFKLHDRIEQIDARTGLTLRAGFFSILSVGGLNVSEERMQCTHLTAACRQYVSKVYPGDAIVNRTDHELRSGKDKLEIIRFDADPSLSTELAIEDISPFGPHAMVQRPLNSRLAGGTDLLKYSFADNPGLRTSLWPYAMENR